MKLIFEVIALKTNIFQTMLYDLICIYHIRSNNVEKKFDPGIKIFPRLYSFFFSNSVSSLMLMSVEITKFFSISHVNTKFQFAQKLDRIFIYIYIMIL